MDPAARNHHATVVAIDDKGVLIEGAPGSGKSYLALALLRDAQGSGRRARLVADDQVLLDVIRGRLVATAPESTAGLIEMRGTGILSVPHQASAVLFLAVRMVADEEAPRLPDPDARRRLHGVELAQLTVARAMAGVAWHAVSLALAAADGE